MEGILSNEWKFLQNIYQILVDENVFGIDSSQPIVEFADPAELKKLINLSINEESSSGITEISKLCHLVIRYSVKTNHPMFHNQLYGQMDPFGLAGSWISEALNTSAYTFEVAPVFSLIETEIIQKLCEIVGYTHGDGIFAPGGSLSNMYAIVLARYKKVPNIKEYGLSGHQQLVMFTSEESHYSFRKGMHWLGMGTRNIILIKTDKLGRMSVDDLEKKILESEKEGKLPFFVNATAGSTVLGAFDKINEIAEICTKYDLWLHVDACHGGAVLLSEANRELLSGITRADSMAWNPHKAIGVPLQCAVFLTKHSDFLIECNRTEASYLFQPDKFYDVCHDTGNKSIQCGRKTDAFKLWLMFKARGLSAFGTLVDRSINMAKSFIRKLKHNDRFRLVQDEFDYTNVCFWYIPESLRHKPENEEWWKEIFSVPARIKQRMVKKGSLMIGYCPLEYRNLGNFFRMVFTCYPVLEEGDLDFLIQEIELLGQ